MSKFKGYLIRVGGGNGVVLPLSYMAVETYKATPSRRIEESAESTADGYLQRVTLEHTRSTVMFDTPQLTLAQVETLNGLLGLAEDRQRNVRLEYWNDERSSYAEGDFYVPDIEYTIRRVTADSIVYLPLHYEFIEY